MNIQKISTLVSALAFLSLVYTTLSEFMNQVLRNHIGQRTVNVKIGVFHAQNRSSSHFWIEFDPLIELTWKSGQILLPYVVVSDPNTTSAQFNINENYPFCSSLNPPAKIFKSIDELAPSFNESCSKALLPEDREKYFAEMIKPSFECGFGSNVRLSKTYPAISLVTIISELQRTIHLLDIDAQGSDTEVSLEDGNCTPYMVLILTFSCISLVYFVPWRRTSKGEACKVGVSNRLLLVRLKNPKRLSCC